MKRALALLAPAALAACATVPAETGRAVSARVEAGVGAPAPWPQTERARVAQSAAVDALLAAPVTPEIAVRIALARNARVIAAYEELGVARAAYLEAVLPPNPSVSGARLSGAEAEPAKLSAAVGLDLLDVLALPLRARAGVAARDAAIARVTGNVLHVAGAARAATIAAIAARQDADLLAQAADAADAAADTADALFAAGNIAKVDRDRERLFAEGIGVQRDLAQAAAMAARARAAAALGLEGAAAQNLTLAPRLPAAPAAPLDPAAIETRAVAASVDIAVATGALEASRAMARAGWITSLLPGLEIDLERERDGGAWKSGPGLTLTAPIFDLGGRARLKLASAARRDAALARAITAEVAAEARARAVEAEAARAAAVRRREVMAPLSVDVFEGAQKDFGAMQIGLVQLIDAKRARLDEGRALVSATRDYWLAQARVDLLIAGVRSMAAEPASSQAAQRDAGGGH